MYLLSIHIPVYLDGNRVYVEQTWIKDLKLARDWLACHFGGLKVMAPYLPFDAAIADRGYQLEEISPDDGIDIIPVIPADCSFRSYWFRERKRWLATFRELAPNIDVVHGGVGNPLRPMQLLSHRAAVRRGIPSVFVGLDHDVFETGKSILDAEHRILHKAAILLWLFLIHKAMRYGARTADLTLLKEGVIFDRYEAGAKCARAFCHSMYSIRDVVDDGGLDARLLSLQESRPLRFVYCGRFVQRKGLSDSIAVIHQAIQQGAMVSLDIIGDGEEKKGLQEQIERLKLVRHVRIHEAIPYQEVLKELAQHDALLFTPLRDDTPRVVFDAYAAGLPIIGYDIAFLRKRAENGEPVLTAPLGDTKAVADIICRLDSDRVVLANLSRSAQQFGRYHSSENWYRRRSEWTLEACGKERGY